VIGRSEGMECAARFSRRSLARVRATRTSAKETTLAQTVEKSNKIYLKKPVNNKKNLLKYTRVFLKVRKWVRNAPRYYI
jgi:hypothetical protein